METGVWGSPRWGTWACLQALGPLGLASGSCLFNSWNTVGWATARPLDQGVFSLFLPVDKAEESADKESPRKGTVSAQNGPGEGHLTECPPAGLLCPYSGHQRIRNGSQYTHSREGIKKN